MVSSDKLKIKKNLNTHLINDLEINGVPKNLSGSIIPFKYNDFEGLKKIVENKKLSTKMEVIRDIQPQRNFFKKLNLAQKKDSINFR